MLCSADPKTLTGRIAYSQDLLAELGGTRPARPCKPASDPPHRVGAGRLPPAHGRVGGRRADAGAARRAGRQTGLDVVCVTDHNVTSAAVAAAERDLGVRIIVGEEIRTPDGDVIGLFLTERIPYVLPLAEVVGRIRAQGGLVYVPHPFDRVRSSLGGCCPACASGAPWTSSRCSTPRSPTRR